MTPDALLDVALSIRSSAGEFDQVEAWQDPEDSRRAIGAGSSTLHGPDVPAAIQPSP